MDVNKPNSVVDLGVPVPELSPGVVRLCKGGLGRFRLWKASPERAHARRQAEGITMV